MKAEDFLHSKEIEIATCYTNKDTYYFKDLVSLLDEYARIQIEKDRERICKLLPLGALDLHSDIKDTPITLD